MKCCFLFKSSSILKIYLIYYDYYLKPVTYETFALFLYILKYSLSILRKLLSFIGQKFFSAAVNLKFLGVGDINIESSYTKFQLNWSKGSSQGVKLSFDSFYIVKSWFLAIFRCKIRALPVGLQRSAAYQFNRWPVDKILLSTKKISPFVSELQAIF